MAGKIPLIVRSYFLSRGLFQFVSKHTKFLLLVLKSGLVGFWLGVLERRHLHRIDETHWSGEEMYVEEEYNLGGLWSWEQRLIESYYGGCQRLLVSSVGGGREVIALHRLGFRVDGFECHRDLLRFSNDLLAKVGAVADLRLAARDECPDLGRGYDGLVVGWGSYGLIQGRERRIALLRKLRQHTDSGAPIMLSFFARSPRARYFRAIARGANLLRRILGRAPLEAGDVLDPYFVHYFTEEEIGGELRDGGFELKLYSTEVYAHAVGTAT